MGKKKTVGPGQKGKRGRKACDDLDEKGGGSRTWKENNKGRRKISKKEGSHAAPAIAKKK